MAVPSGDRRRADGERECLDDAKAALRLGARAVVQKRFALETLIAAIQAAVDGFVSSPPISQAEVTGASGGPSG